MYYQQPVEGVTYIFDRYAYLNLDIEATLDEIKAAIKKLRVENHPDNLGRASQDIKNQAARVNDLISQCEDILLNPEKKATYDTLLKAFQANHPRKLSKDGSAMIDLGDTESYFALSLLMAEGGEDEPTDELVLAFRQVSGHDEAQLERARKFYKVMPEDTDAREMLLDALLKYIEYLSVLETEGWHALGMVNSQGIKNMLPDPEYYASDVEQAVEDMISHILPQQVSAMLNAVQIGMAKPPLFLTGPKTDTTALATSGLPTAEAILEKAKANVEERRHKLAEAAQKKGEAFKEVMQLLKLQRLTPLPETPGTLITYLMHPTEDSVFAAFQADDETKKITVFDNHGHKGAPLQNLIGSTHPTDAVVAHLIKGLEQPLMILGPIINERRKRLGLE